MLSSKPYLIRAFYEWITDSSCTPYLMVDALHPRCRVPQQFVENGQIILDISKSAIRDLVIRADTVQFRASFSGIVHMISVPVRAVLGIYAHENQQGMFFEAEEDEAEGTEETEGTDTGTGRELFVAWTGNGISPETAEGACTKTAKKRDTSHLRVVE